FDLPGQVKRFCMARPILNSSAQINPTITLNVDYADIANPGPFFSQGPNAPWNTSPWNTTPWGGRIPYLILKKWLGIQGIGYAASGRLSFQTAGIALQWFSTDYMFEPGGPL